MFTLNRGVKILQFAVLTPVLQGHGHSNVVKFRKCELVKRIQWVERMHFDSWLEASYICRTEFFLAVILASILPLLYIIKNLKSNQNYLLSF